jgi:hypothetical protein
MLLGMFHASRRGEFATTGSTLGNLLGRAAAPVRSSKESPPRAERPRPSASRTVWPWSASGRGRSWLIPLLIVDVTVALIERYPRYMPPESRPQPERFLLVSASTAGGPASLRVQVWRKLRSLGALYLQQSVCLLPARQGPIREVRRLLARVHSEGGTGRVITIGVPDEREYAALVTQFNAARDAEYAEVLERTPAMLAEIATETRRGRASYVEVEESEADLDRFRAWLAKIAARDYFDAPGRVAAEAAVAQCAQALAEFEEAALRVEAHEPDRPTASAGRVRRLRIAAPDGQH